MLWQKNNDDAWVGTVNDVATAGIIKKILDSQRKFVVFYYAGNNPVYQHNYLGVFDSMKDAQQKAKEFHGA